MLHAVSEFIRYYFRAQTKYRVHSPSLFEFVKEVVDDDRTYYSFGRIEGIRARMLQDRSIIRVQDLGAGSNFSKQNERRVDQIASTAVSSFEKCKLLYRIVKYYEPLSILELGTSLGISGSYLANLAPTTTIEGSDAIADIAKSNFHLQQLDVDLKRGDIGTVLQTLSKEGHRYDLVVADGNHRKEPTLKYFNQLLPMLNEGGIILFDDIYWSKGMTEAWEAIKKDDRVQRTIDLYTFGVVELGSNKQPEHHTLIRSRLKPFQFGFFSRSKD